MEDNQSGFETIDEYIAMFPQQIQGILQELRRVIRETAPEATEKISYQMPTFYLYTNLVHFAAFKNHIGFFPTSSGVEAFADKLTGYKTSKGTIQFQLNQPIPYDLVREIVEYRVQENTRVAAEKKAKA